MPKATNFESNMFKIFRKKKEPPATSNRKLLLLYDLKYDPVLPT
jgi:hypothetical protein